MNIVQHAWEKFQGVCTLIADVLEKKVDYLTFLEQLKKALDGLGCQIIREVLEAADTYLREHREERPGWQVERKDDPKTILTPFGQVTYRRTYYRHKETGSCAYLVDSLAGYGPHQKVDVLVKAEAVERATELSYCKSGEISPAVVVSAETVMKELREFTPRDASPPPKVKRKCRYLFVEADEDHVSGQDKKNHLPRLVYVHEGKERVGSKRKRLRNPRYFAGIYKDVEELWYAVLDYLDTHYEGVEVIFVCGDGDWWIRKGVEILPGSVFVLDLFHLDKYLVAALGKGSEDYRRIWAALRQKDQLGAESILKEAAQKALTPGQKKAIRDCRRYIRRNWDGIIAYRLYPEAELGVSAEGHVSHILSSRLSSRPMAWSEKGVDQMARLRATKANGVSVRQLYVEQYRQGLPPLPINPEVLAGEWQKLKKVSGEVLDNLPALRGPVSQLTKALKMISHNISFLW